MFLANVSGLISTIYEKTVICIYIYIYKINIFTYSNLLIIIYDYKLTLFVIQNYNRHARNGLEQTEAGTKNCS